MEHAARVLVALALAATGMVTATGAAAAAGCVNTPTPGGPVLRSPYVPGEVEQGQQALWEASGQPQDTPSTYLLYVPEHLPEGPVPLVMTIHGLLGTAKQHLNQTGWMQVADEAGFVVAVPNGPRRWDMTQGSESSSFMRDVVADVRLRNCVDDSRLYVTGHSNGAVMTHRMACESGDLFAAAASYAAGEIGNFAAGTPCAADGLDADGNPIPGFLAVPLGMWHGDNDAIVDYNAGRRGLREWLARDDCDTTPAEHADEFGRWEVYEHCTRGDFKVSFRTLSGHGHAWPDGCGGQQSTGGSVDCEPDPGTGPWPEALDLAHELWAYLSGYTRPEPAVPQGPPAPGAPEGPQRDDLATWTTSGVGTNIDSEPTFRRLGGPVVTEKGLELTLVLRVSYDGDAGGLGASHPVCPTSNPGPGTQTMPDRQVTVSATDRHGLVSEVVVTTETVLLSGPSSSVEQVELVRAVLPGSDYDPSNTVLRAGFEGDMLGFWWVCGTPAGRYKETLSCEDANVPPQSACP